MYKVSKSGLVVFYNVRGNLNPIFIIFAVLSWLNDLKPSNEGIDYDFVTFSHRAEQMYTHEIQLLVRRLVRRRIFTNFTALRKTV